MEIITSVNNKLIKDTIKLHQKKYRDLSHSFIIEGEHLVEIASSLKVLKRVFVLKEFENKYNYDNQIIVNDSVMKKLSNTTSIVPIIAICDYLKEKPLSSSKILMLDNIQDPGNLGTLIRTALSFGFNDIIVSENTCDCYNDKVVRSTQGSLFEINFLRNDLKSSIALLREKGYLIYGTALKDANELKSISKSDKICLILGNEGNGVSKELLELADKNIYVEMSAFESLNVAIAGGILMYYFK